METSQVKQDTAVQPAAPETQKGTKPLKVPMPRKKKKWIKRAIILAVLAAVVIFLFRSCMSAGTALLSGAYLPSTVSTQDLLVSVSGTGAIEPIRSYRVTSLVRGEVVEAPFEEGGTVQEGDLLFRIDSTDVETAIQQAQLSLESARLNYQQLLKNQEDNLKNATHWGVKSVGVELLRDQVEHGMMEHILHICTHFSNLIKVSERVVVRHDAGAALVRILPLLRRDQRNEVVVELGKGLEMGQYEISKYIPQYLGQAALYLYPSELDEQVLWLKTLLGSPNDSAVSGALNTIGVLLQHYPAYRERFSQSSQSYEDRRQELLGLLLQGLAHYRPAVRQEALLVTGNLLFESNILPMEEKAHLFALSSCSWWRRPPSRTTP